MLSKHKFGTVLFVFVGAGVVFFSIEKIRDVARPERAAADLVTSANVAMPKPEVDLNNALMQTLIDGTKDKSAAAVLDAPIEPVEVIKLTAGNFESLVINCFQNDPCELQEDPWTLYERFKRLGNDKAMDNLISFLRSRLGQPEWREKYQAVLGRMIADFYPEIEKQFQTAAYFSYLGDHAKSLEIYLDLEMKTATNPALRPAPKLNIANEFYDLKRYREALPYYESALEEFYAKNYDSRNQKHLFGFVEERIREIKAR